jgi:hypothetical protein
MKLFGYTIIKDEKLFVISQDAFNEKKKMEALLEKSEQLLHEKNELKAQLEKHTLWESNPFALLNHYGIVMKEHNLLALPPEERLDYARQIHNVFTGDAYKKEMETFAAGIRDKILTDTASHEETERHRLLLVFVAGVANRFGQLSAQYLANRKQQQIVDRSHSVNG